MGLGRLIKRLYYRGLELEHWKYDLERRALPRIIHPLTSSKKRLQKSESLVDSGDDLVVTIWYRPLESFFMRLIRWKRTGHWCIQVSTTPSFDESMSETLRICQVGDKYYELLLDKAKKPPTYLGTFLRVTDPFESARS